MVLIAAYIGKLMQDTFRVAIQCTNILYFTMGPGIWYPYAIGLALWLVQHWIFTSQYLRVALTFELMFKEHSPENLERKKKRERAILVANIVMFCLTVAFLTLLLVY